MGDGGERAGELKGLRGEYRDQAGSGGPVAVDTDHYPAFGCEVEDIGRSEAAVAAADHVEVDDGVLAVVGELRQGETKDEVAGGAIAIGRIQVQEGIGLVAGDEGGGRQRMLFPKIRVPGERYFF